MSESRIVKKIDTSLKPSAFELKFRDKTYVFVILRHIRTTRDNDLWISSYNSIRKFYTNKIIIIDDNSNMKDKHEMQEFIKATFTSKTYSRLVSTNKKGQFNSISYTLKNIIPKNKFILEIEK